MLRYDEHTFRQTAYMTGPPFPENADLYMSLFGLFQSLGNYEVEQVLPHGSAFHAVQEGEGTLEVDGRIFEIKPGDLFILRKGEHCIYHDRPGKPWKYFYFILSGKNAESYLDEIGLTPERSVINIATLNRLWVKLNLLKENIPANGMSGVESVRTGWEIFELLKKRCDQDNPPEKAALAETAKHIIDSSPQVITNVNLLAEALRTSRVSLFRNFKDCYGVSVKEYMNRVRFERIEKLLGIPTLTVNEVARMAGFDNPQYFRRLFQQEYNQTPTQWREGHRVQRPKE